MKRTTYIILSLLFTGLVIVGAILFYCSRQGIPEEDNFLKIYGNMKKISIAECKFVKCYAARGNDQGVGFGGCKLLVHPSGKLVGEMIYQSGWDKYLTEEIVGDTLKLLFWFPNDKIDSKYKSRYLNIVSDSIILNLPSSAFSFINSVHSMGTFVSGFNRDTLSVSTHGFTEVKESELSSLFVAAPILRLESGKIEKLYVDLDQTGDWTVTTGKFQIDTEYLMSSRNQRNALSKGECQHLIWIPKKDDATLELSIREPMELSIKDK